MRLKKKTIIQVGLFVTIGLFLSFLSIFFIGRERNLFSQGYTLIAPFKEVNGLRKGAVVQLAGLNVGYVSGVRFPKDAKADYFEVILEIGKDYKDYIRKDSRASLQTQGLLGDKYILISRGSSNQPPLKQGDILLAEDVSGVSALLERSQKMVKEIEAAAKSFRKVLDRLPMKAEDEERLRATMKDVKAITEDLRVVVDEVRKGEGTIGGLLKDPSLYHDLRALLGHANRSKLLKNLIRATLAEQEKGTSAPLEKEDQ